MRRLPCLFLVPEISQLVPKTGAKFWYQFSGARIWYRFPIRMSWALRPIYHFVRAYSSRSPTYCPTAIHLILCDKVYTTNINQRCHLPATPCRPNHRTGANDATSWRSFTQ